MVCVLEKGSLHRDVTVHSKTSCGMLSHVQHRMRVSSAVLPFSKLNEMFFGYFDPENIFLDNKNK